MQQVKAQLVSWQEEFKNAYRSVDALERDGFLLPPEREHLRNTLSQYSLFLTPYYASLIDKKDPHCPIRKQALPSQEELEEDKDLVSDPLQDLKHQPAPRITHRYQNRALLHLTANCSMYCRYCFRKSLLNELKDDFLGGDLEKALQYLKGAKEIEEVILSGGDPLLVSDANLRSVLLKLAEIPHIKRIRIHTRVPVTCPMRVTEELTHSLAAVSKPLVFVLHFNHPKEVTNEARASIDLLKKISAPILNQSVLLKGVNNDALVLKSLSEKLFEAGVLPYYLHHPDNARGTKHFQLTQAEGLSIYRDLKKSLPGYLVPRYVEDKLNYPYKSSLH